MTKKNVTITVLLFIFFLLATFPARTAFNLLPESVPVTATGVSGSIWSGHAASLTMNRQSLTDIEWSINPLWLLTGKLGGSMNVADSKLSAVGGWRLGFDQTVYLSSVSVTVDASKLAPHLPMRGIALEGDIRADIESLEFHPEQGPADVEATIYWLKGAASISGPVIKLGNFTLKAESQDNQQIDITLQKSQNLLDAQGKILVNWNKDIALDISVTEQVPEQLKSTIAFLKQGDNGRRHLQMTVPFKR